MADKRTPPTETPDRIDLGADADAVPLPESTDRRSESRAAADEKHTSRIERIARRAYDICQSRGAEHGRELEDWLQAEREIDGE